MVEAIVAGLAGSGTGFLGSFLGRVVGIFESKEKAKQRQADYDHELKLLDKQQQGRQEELEHEHLIVQTQAHSEALVGSYSHDSSYSNTALRWVRPALTALLIVASTLIYLSMPDEVTKSELAARIIYFAGVAISWWFADRSGNQSK